MEILIFQSCEIDHEASFKQGGQCNCYLNIIFRI